MSNDQCLIEDYIPSKAISAEARREKSIRKSHISTRCTATAGSGGAGGDIWSVDASPGQ
jgi:hypothetical protein